MRTLLYTASDSGFDLSQIPLGGAAPICAFLTKEWSRQTDFAFRLLSPDVIGAGAPRDHDLLNYTPKQYIDFLWKFERAITDEILRFDPRDVVVLSNDMSDGPRFQELAEKGYAVFCIYHMNMVQVVTKAFLFDVIRPETSAAIYRAIDRSMFRFVLPGFLKLVFRKQEESLRYCRGVIVPSAGMKRLLLRMYRDVPESRIHVCPWGSQAETLDESAVQSRAAELRRQYGIGDDVPVLLMLSRISPEKGHDRLIGALELWERDADFPSTGVHAVICGVAGYRHAQSFERKLKDRAARLEKVRVTFPGYVSGLDKQAHFRLATLYVFPSRYESYGLTLMEAFHNGLAAVACHTDGTEHLVRKEFGELLPPAAEREVPVLLKQAIKQMLADRDRLRAAGRAAKAFAEANRFSDTAARIATLLMAEPQPAGRP
ncbi:MAG TPA: glycosyltransferase family 4 protein [Vicinamibacterales bacterium]|nr:glycosyltransferase family 4 protein [Vicinamibacterales bacterium]